MGSLQFLLGIIALRLHGKIGSLSERELLHEYAKLYVGRDASPLDVASDDLGCAESVTSILRNVIPFPIIVGTATLFELLNNDERFFSSGILPTEGDIIISPTGSGNGSIRGHVGIVGEDERIYSNNSYTGNWEQNYIVESWRKRYEMNGGMPVFFFTLKVARNPDYARIF